jgi:YD repeat-containing protein
MGQLNRQYDSGWTSPYTFTYNNQGLRVAVSNFLGQVSRVTYDMEDHPVRVEDASSVVVTNSFDFLGRLIVRGYAATNSVEQFAYSGRGLVAHINALDLTNFYGYSALRQKTAETNANYEHTLFTYSPAGDLLTLTDGKDHTTTWQHDLYGRVTNKLDATSTAMRCSWWRFKLGCGSRS